MGIARELAELGSAYNSGGINQIRNRIINGAMVINQRGYNGTPAADTYTIDRWQARLSQASKYSVAQSSTAPAGFVSSMLVTSTSAYSIGAGDYFAMQQPIEGYNTADLNWGTANAKTITVSFWVRSSLTGTFGGALQNDGGSYCYPFSYTISSANTWEQKSVTIAGPTAGSWSTTNSSSINLFFALGVGSTYSGTAGSWVATNRISATGATSVVGTNGATFYITGVQLEKGTQATSFEYRQFGQELALCQRYFQKSYALGTVAGSAGFDGIVGRTGTASSGTFTAGEIFWCLVYSVAMRTTPTFTLYDSAGNSGKCTRTAFGIADYTNSNADVPSGNEKSALLRSASGSSAGAACFQYYSTAEL